MTKIIGKNKVSPPATLMSGFDEVEVNGKKYYYDQKLLQEMEQFQKEREFKMFAGKRGLEAFSKTMMEEAGSWKPSKTTITPGVQKVLELDDPEENYDIPESERMTMMEEAIMKLTREEAKVVENYIDRKKAEYQKKMYYENEVQRFNEAMKSTPTSPNHGGRLRPLGKGILSQIEESGTVTAYKSLTKEDLDHVIEMVFKEEKKKLGF